MKRSLKERGQRGFTLVELLVVMAIISLLAAIVVPNVINYIRQGRATRARADISGIESSLVKLLADSGRSNLGQLFNPDQVALALGVTPGNYLTANQYLNAVQLYTNVFYVLLREGRGAGTLADAVPGANGFTYAQLLNNTVVRKLGTSYINVGFDPWGNLFNIYPGPWPSANGPTPFRKYLAEGGTGGAGAAVLPGRGDSPDALTLADVAAEADSGLFTDLDTQETLTIGYPAPRDKVAFVWSNGENLFSGQAIYQGGPLATQYDGAASQNYYDLNSNQEGLQLGGGDDINNWDNGASWGRFY